MDNEILDLETEVSRIEGVVPSAVTLLQRLFDAYENRANDATAIRDLTARARARVDELAAAVAAKTPADNPDTDPA